jgi:hypothetical protein
MKINTITDSYNSKSINVSSQSMERGKAFLMSKKPGQSRTKSRPKKEKVLDKLFKELSETLQENSESSKFGWS